MPTTEYTGYYFRKTSATLLADARIHLLRLQSTGGWMCPVTSGCYMNEASEKEVKILQEIIHRIQETFQKQLQ